MANNWFIRAVFLGVLAIVGLVAIVYAASEFYNNDSGNTAAQQVNCATTPDDPLCKKNEAQAQSDSGSSGSSQSSTSQGGSQLPDRRNCAEIRGTDYGSGSERQWYLANCVSQPSSAPADTCYLKFPQIPAGNLADIPAGCNVVGDVSVWDGTSFVRKYDDDPTTGLFTSCPSGCRILADYKSNATSRSIGDLNREGCGPGCRFTTIQNVPSAQTATAADTCYEQFSKILPGQIVDIPAGCNVVGDIKLWNGSTFVRKYDNEAATGLYTPCPGGCRIQADFTANATSRSITDLNSKEGCGPGCRFTTVQNVP